jgi:diaminopimelate decarboxylase
MTCWQYHNDKLYIENVVLNLVAMTYDTPCYVYSRAAIESNWRAFDTALKTIPHRICYAIKANSNLSILNLLAKLGSGFDIVSLGELERVLAAKGDASKVIFSGVGKKKDEITIAIKKGIYCFNIESLAEAERIHDIAKTLKTKVNVALRINPDIDANTHAYISTGMNENKFGVIASEAVSTCQKIHAMSALTLIGIACHIGSQITTLAPFQSALDFLLTTYETLNQLGIPLKTINVGGGLGIIYHHEQPPAVNEYAAAIIKKAASYPVEIIIEPGRAIIGNAGILLTRVEYIKHNEHKNFAIVDAGMNDLMRPALYQAWQQILPVNRRNNTKTTYDIVGPVCESADFLGKNRELTLEVGDLLAIDSAGAYGFSMSSNYNTRPRPAEVLIDNAQMRLIRRREEVSELYSHEIRELEQ